MRVRTRPSSSPRRQCAPPKPTVIPPLAHGALHDQDRAITEVLEDAAHLINQASRQLRVARQHDSAYALQAFADEIHEHIRLMPGARPNRRPNPAPVRDSSC